MVADWCFQTVQPIVAGRASKQVEGIVNTAGFSIFPFRSIQASHTWDDATNPQGVSFPMPLISSGYVLPDTPRNGP